MFARDLDDIFIDLNQDVTDLFSAERMTIFVVDGVKREWFLGIKPVRSWLKLEFLSTRTRWPVTLL